MSDTYNILKKYAYLDATWDPVYGIGTTWRDGTKPDDYVLPLNFISGAPFEDNVAKAVSVDANGQPLLDEKGNPLYRRDARLISTMLFSKDEGSVALAFNVYHKLVRGAFFEKKDPETQYLAEKFPYLWQSALEKANEIKENNSGLYHLVRSTGQTGENIIGSEVDYLADEGFYDKIRSTVAARSRTTDADNDDADDSQATILDVVGDHIKERLALQRARANSYAFSNYVPGMVATGLVPAAIGAFMGRPILGAVLGAALSGGLGYYGYNRLYNPNFKGYDWLDKRLGFTPGTNTDIPQEASAQTNWENYEKWKADQLSSKAVKTKVPGAPPASAVNTQPQKTTPPAGTANEPAVQQAAVTETVGAGTSPAADEALDLSILDSDF